MKKIVSILMLSVISVIGITIGNDVSDVSALTYSDNVGVNFTFSPSLSVSLSSSDIVINNLTPGTSSDSNIVDINVLSNNLSGYSLNATVGNDSTYNNANLTSISGNTFTSLTPSDSIVDISSFNDNQWGYSYSDQTVSTPTWSDYSGLPLYNTTGATLKTATGPSSSSGDDTYFKIAAKASPTQASGTYNNVINFTVVGNTNPTSFYDAFKEAQAIDPTITTLNGYYKMQDMTPAICNAVELYDDDSHIRLIDTRDHEVYWIGKLKDDRCWLLDNLRLGSNDYEIPLTPEDTNIETAWTLPKGIISGFGSYINAQINAAYKNDTNVTSYGTASGKVGVYYNYCAASGGTYCYPGGEGNTNAEHDICPSSWHLPTSESTGEYNTVYSSYDTTQNIANPVGFRYNFSTTLTGSFTDNDTRNNLNANGYWWSSTYDDGNGFDMRYLGITNSGVGPSNHVYRRIGFSVRCLANN